MKVPKIPTYEITLVSTPIKRRRRKLRARWTAEIDQELQAFHCISAEDEIRRIMKCEMERQINEEKPKKSPNKTRTAQGKSRRKTNRKRLEKRVGRRNRSRLSNSRKV